MMAELEDDPWGDEFDDNLMLTATQLMEEEEEKRNPETNERSKEKVSSGSSLSPAQAAQALAFRRECLQQQEDSEPFQFSESLLSEDPHACVLQLQAQNAKEKQKYQDLRNDLLAAQGESGNLRRQVETLRRTQQEELSSRLKRDRDEKQTNEVNTRQLELEITALKTDLRRANDEIANVKSKSAMYSSGKLSIGGAGTQRPTTFSPQYPTPATSKFRSDPNLSIPLRKPFPQQHLKGVSTSVSVVAVTEQVEVDHKSVQANEHRWEIQSRDELIFGKDNGPINIGKFESIDSMSSLKKRKIVFQELVSKIHSDFLNVQAELERIVERAPTEIMFGLVRGVEVKKCFPDVADSMFQWAVQDQRKRENLLNGDPVGIVYPILPSATDPGIINFDELLSTLESGFIHGSAWDTLRQIKANLKIILHGINGDLRFRLYEVANLQALWKLLAWAKAMWKCILFEEERDEIVSVHGKDLWAQELREWTGLVLKIDWRDVFVPELEMLIRQFSLSILEYIATLGYFERLQRRYEILYCILKDTLTKDQHRHDRSVRRCLSILTSSIADQTIFNYMCLKNNDGNCLAHIIGVNVLKCFREIKNPYSATSLFIYYCNLLETLMLEQPHYYYSSKIARPNQCQDVVRPENQFEHADTNTNDSIEEMEVDLMNSQFACPDKYKLEDDGKERLQRLSKNIELVPCWISPREWEPTESHTSETKPCQCRKALLGSTFVMLRSVIEFWKIGFLQSERKMDELDQINETELSRMKEIMNANSNTNSTSHKDNEYISKFSEKMESLRDFMKKCQGAPAEIDPVIHGVEWTWQDILKKRRSLIPDPEPEWVQEKRRPENIFDYAIRRGVLLMNFCYSQSGNMAAAIGSEAFNCFTLAASEFRFYIDDMHLTSVERDLITEFTTLEDESEDSASPTLSDDGSTIEDEDIITTLPTFDAVSILVGLPDSSSKTGVSDEEFENNLKYFGY